MPQALRLVLRWWLILLGGELAQSRKWRDEAAGPVAHLFCDAASRPPMAAAVLFVDNKCYWTCMPPAARHSCTSQRQFVRDAHTRVRQDLEGVPAQGR